MEDQRMTAARFTDLVDAYGGIWRVGRPTARPRPVTFCAAIHGTRVNWRRRPSWTRRWSPAGRRRLGRNWRRRSARAAPRAVRRVPASVPVLVPLRPSPARWAAVLGAPHGRPWRPGWWLCAGALVGASDGALVSVADPPDAATWIEASISAAAGDIEWEVLR